jgi:cell wall-associated NlpC family hydrolase
MPATLGAAVTGAAVTGRIALAIVGGIVVLIMACGGLVGVMVSGALGGGCAAAGHPSVATPATPPTTPRGGFAPIGAWNSEAVGNAATVIAVGARMGAPARAWVIAVATAIQESPLTNLPDLGDANNADSLGLFQQRPSQGWGTPAQITDPVYASTKFYQHLLAVPGWQTMPLAQAAQAVQGSAFPDAYARWEADATRIVAALTGNLNPGALGGCIGTDGEMLAPPAGYTLPADTPPAVVTAIGWAVAQLGTPYAFGGDCTAAHSGDPAHQCDCSSLVQQAYAAAGVPLPRIAADQSRAGTPVNAVSELRPGDLVFLAGAGGTRTQPGHIGMYLGSGLVIDAPQTGQVVHITTLGHYWTDSPAALRRVVH